MVTKVFINISCSCNSSFHISIKKGGKELTTQQRESMQTFCTPKMWIFSLQVLNRSIDPRTYETPAPLLPAIPQVPLLPQHIITSGTRKDCVRLRGLPYEAQVEHILEFLGDYAKNIVFQGVHMVYNAQVGNKVLCLFEQLFYSSLWQLFYFLCWEISCDINCTINRRTIKNYIRKVNTYRFCNC